jgi:hypothetical protein
MPTNTVTQQMLTTVISDITFADTGTFNIGNLPPNAVLVDLKVNVTTAFDSATSDSLAIGYGAAGGVTADDDAFETAIDLQSTGNATLTLLNVGQAIDTGINLPLTAKVTSAGGSLSAGAATVVFTYAQK